MTIQELAQMAYDHSAYFHSGLRVLQLIDRNIKGTNGCSKRWHGLYISNNHFEFKSVLANMVEAVETESTNATDLRIYCSVNPRDFTKASHEFRKRQLELEFQLLPQQMEFYSNLHAKWVSCLMSPSCMRDKNFLIDFDYNEKSKKDELIDWFVEHDVIVVEEYASKKGHHFITDPFNPAIFEFEGAEIKKNALALLYWKGKYNG